MNYFTGAVGRVMQDVIHAARTVSREYVIVPGYSLHQERRSRNQSGVTQKNGRTPRTCWTDSANRGARSRRPSFLDLRRRQFARRIRRESLPLFVEHFSGASGHAPAQRPAASRQQSGDVQIPLVAQRPARRTRRSNSSGKIGPKKERENQNAGRCR
jgi:hypothetical protein